MYVPYTSRTVATYLDREHYGIVWALLHTHFLGIAKKLVVFARQQWMEPERMNRPHCRENLLRKLPSFGVNR